MHFMPDTEDQDSAAETFWPEGYKQVIREIAPSYFWEILLKDEPFIPAYRADYASKYAEYPRFVEKLAEILAIALENGADNAFDEIIDAFLKEAPLPPLRAYAHYFTAAVIPPEIAQPLTKSITEEYSQDSIYVYAYGVGYKKTFVNAEDYLQKIAEIVVDGARNQVQSIMEDISRRLYYRQPLPPVRRHPRRLKVW